jgi:hypothetical protein
MNRYVTRLIPLLIAAVAAQANPAAPGLPTASPVVDPEPFFRQLEAIGLSTGPLRVVADHTRIVVDTARSRAERGHHTKPHRILLPESFREGPRPRLRPDLSTHQIEALVHEFSHAKDDLDGAGRDEATAIFIGRTIAEVHAWTNWVIDYNLTRLDDYLRDPKHAADLGATIFLPDPKLGRAETAAAEFVFGRDHSGQPNPVLYQSRLRMKPPKDAAEQLERLNTLDNEWLQSVRAELLRVRAEWAAARQRAEAPEAEGRKAPSFGGLEGPLD